MTKALRTGIRRVAGRLAPTDRPDGELLSHFLAHRDEGAFAVLVRRHGPMVLGICRRVLGHAADADDAFQAAFVVLVRKAHALTGRACVGPFLYTAARHAALKVRTMVTRRTAQERKAARSELQVVPVETDELAWVLDEELGRLPDKYRDAVVLCELEGVSRKEAAARLGCPEGTVSSRLATAHRLLAKRLLVRGFATVGLMPVMGGRALAVPHSLAAGAVRSVTNGPSAEVSQLAAEVSKMLFVNKLRVVTAGVAGVILLLGAVTAVPQRDAAAGGRSTLKAPAPRADEGLPDEPKSKASEEPKVKTPEEPAWKGEFRKAYGLKDGELVRRVAAPFPDCRAEHFRDRIRAAYRRSGGTPPEAELDRDYSAQFTVFNWKDDWATAGWQTWTDRVDDGVRLDLLLDMTLGVPKTRLDATDALRETTVTGDFVVRTGTDPEKVVAQLERILQKECELTIGLKFRDAEEEVYVLSGTYSAKPLEERQAGEIEVYAGNLVDRKRGGGGGGTLEDLARHLERYVSQPVVLDAIKGAPKRLSWHDNIRFPANPAQRAADHNPEQVMANVADQTGLTVKLEKRTIRTLRVDERDKK